MYGEPIFEDLWSRLYLEHRRWRKLQQNAVLFPFFTT